MRFARRNPFTSTEFRTHSRELSIRCRLLAIAVLLPALLMTTALDVRAQGEAEPPKHEFRGAWIATVINLDWPKTSATESQKEELIEMLDELKAAGINAVFFQVRSEADAMYESELEPWSYWLTGEQGVAPDPYYDPLEFAVEEAHKRGMELHAWFNPFRADRGSSYEPAENHVTVEHPEWILQIGDLEILNPGIPAVREYVTDVIVDVIERYDVDGVHFDDYFYPYPPNQIDDEDYDTYEEYNTLGFNDIAVWRRYNINMFVKGVHEAIEATKPEVAYGISPFGIWKSGVPQGIVGLDAYSVLYADAVNWLEQQWLDYLTPQLYWAFGGGQDYGKLAPWWAEHAATNERHLYPGHGLYRSDANTFANQLFAADEVPRQVRFNRQHEDIQGSVFFRAQNITQYHSKGFADSLKTDLYRYPALTPEMEWQDQTVPPPPTALSYDWTGEDEVTLTWAPPEGENGAQFYAVYRTRSAVQPDPAELVSDARNLLAVTGESFIADRPGIADDPYYYAVTSVSQNSIESELTEFVSLEGRATSIEDVPTHAFSLAQNFPNPFRGRTSIAFQLDESAPVTLDIYDAVGRRVTSLVKDRVLTPGTYEVEFDADEGLAAGTYFYTLTVNGSRETRSMVLVR